MKMTALTSFSTLIPRVSLALTMIKRYVYKSIFVN